MIAHVTNLAGCLQALFTITAERLGRSTGFIQRQRQLKASDFARVLVWEWMSRPRATLESLARHLPLSPQGLQQRLGPEAQRFLSEMLREALGCLYRARSQPRGVLDRFPAVIVEDTTAIRLPVELASEFPGCGGGSGADEGAAGLKILVRWDVRSGEVHRISVHAGRTSDQALAAEPDDLPDGALDLADQGFFNTERWRRFKTGQLWISRVPARTQVQIGGRWQSLADWLAEFSGLVVDRSVNLVAKTQLPCRLVARRCPPEVAARRKQRLREYTRGKKGRDPSAAQLAVCEWLVFATNVPADRLNPVELWVVYRCRWQIELLFKRAKQITGWTVSSGKRGDRILVELYAKLLGLLLQHWTTLLRGGPLDGVSPTKLFAIAQEFAPRLADALHSGRQLLITTLQHLVHHFARVRAQPRKTKQPSTRQLLIKPTLAA
jgi:Transposase DDE domain